MIFKNITKYILATLFLLIPTIVYAYDVEITCTDTEAPEIVRNTDPLFQLSGFLPGSSASRTIYIVNEGSEHDCRIFFTGSGESNILTDKIEVEVSGEVFSGSLTEYIDDLRLNMADLSPGAQVERTITMMLPTDAGNTYSSQQASFDITIETQGGEDIDDPVPSPTDETPTPTEDTPTVEGVEDTATRPTTPVVSFFRDLLGIGGPDEKQEDVEETEEDIEEEEKDEDKEDEEKVLGEEEVCKRTLWWVPIVIQFLLTIIILSWDRSMLKKKHIKLGMSAMLALAAYFATQRIGCGCNLIWLCENHWILNILIGIFPAVTYIQRRKSEYSSDYPSTDY